ncbi:extensin family protein [Novosphingobium rosa]|uniref:extensin family protein n=1 Tax=Novosphingobium rosa TaxID=76978 RepID=UPI000A01FB53|nr:extensin family protein [Novosphingobium rosa]
MHPWPASPRRRPSGTCLSFRFAVSALSALALAACSSAPQAPQTPRRTTNNWSPAPDYNRCLADLGAKEATFTPLPDQYFGAGCSTIQTVKLLSVRGDYSALGISNLGPVTCRLADAFAGWARYGVDRAARQILGSQLVRIETMGSYNCRNVAGSDHRSGHATASAIDVSAFVLADGRRVSVLGQWNAGTPQEREFLRVIHTSACRRFGMVLGPDYNTAHRNHFHVEAVDSHFCR